MRISDWSSDVCSSDLLHCLHQPSCWAERFFHNMSADCRLVRCAIGSGGPTQRPSPLPCLRCCFAAAWADGCSRSEEHTYELPSLMRISHAVFCLQKKNTTKHISYNHKQSHTQR